MINHVLVIYNPTLRSQVQTEEWIGNLVRELNTFGQYLVSFFPTTAETEPHHLVPLIAPPLNLVIAAGGDGTIRFALAALAKARSSVPLAILPLGTGNVLARNLGIVDYKLLADPLEHALDYILHGLPMKIDLGMMNGEYFGGMAGVGPLSDAFMLPKREDKSNGKLLAYVKSLLDSVAMPTRFFKVSTGGYTFKFQASGIFVANVEDLGIGKIANPSHLNDGLLDMHIINPVEFNDYTELVHRYGQGIIQDSRADLCMKVRECLVEVVPRRGTRSKFQQKVQKIKHFITGKSPNQPQRGEELPCMIDGDQFSTTPMRVTVIPNAVNVLVPPSVRTRLGAVVDYSHRTINLPNAVNM